MKISVLLILLFNITGYTQVKLMFPHEHLGYKLLSNGHEVKIIQNENWHAVYCDSHFFRTKNQAIGWDENANFNFESDSILQPLFYIQGIDTIAPFGINTLWGHKYFNEFNNSELPAQTTQKHKESRVIWVGEINLDGKLDYLVQSFCDHDSIRMDLILSNNKSYITAASFIEWS